MVHIQPASESFNVAAQIVNASSPIPVNTPGEDIAAYYAEVAQHYAEETAGLLDTKVSKTGDNMTGHLSTTGNITVNNNQPHFIGLSTSIDKTSTTAPEQTVFGAILQTRDENENYVSNIFTAHNTNNHFVCGLDLQRTINDATYNAYFGIYIDTSGQDLLYASDGVRQSIAYWSAPKANAEQMIELGASGALYTAPFSGWFCVRLQNNSPQMSVIYNSSAGNNLCTALWTRAANEWICGNLEVAKGDVIRFDYGGAFIAGEMSWIPKNGG